MGSPVFGSEPPGASQHAPASSKAIACVALGSITAHFPSVRTRAPAEVARAIEPSADRAMPSMLANPGAIPGRSTAFQSPPRMSQSRSPEEAISRSFPSTTISETEVASGRPFGAGLTRVQAPDTGPSVAIRNVPALVVAITSGPWTAIDQTPRSWAGSRSSSGGSKTVVTVPSYRTTLLQQDPNRVPAAAQIEPSAAGVSEFAPIRFASPSVGVVHRPSKRSTLDAAATQTAPSADTVIASAPRRSVSGTPTDASIAPLMS